jgi:FMN reductase
MHSPCVHALRGWPTPLGAAINSTENVFDEEGACQVPRIAQLLQSIADELTEFACTLRRP